MIFPLLTGNVISTLFHRKKKLKNNMLKIKERVFYEDIKLSSKIKGFFLDDMVFLSLSTIPRLKLVVISFIALNTYSF